MEWGGRRETKARAGAIVALAALVFVLAACGGGRSSAASSSPSASEPPALKVVTTTTQLTDFAKVIGGSDVSVYPVLKANVDPHDYEPTPADIDALAKADVIVKNGVGLEKWFDDTIKSASPKGTSVDASTGVTILGSNGADEEKAGDPHIWHNPQNAKIMVANIAKAFAAADPAAAARFDANLASYSAQLDQLDADIAGQIGTLSNKKLVTNHDAFGYYVQRYGLEFVGSIIPSFDTQAELSAADVSDLVAKIRSQGVNAVFSESSLPPKTAAAIAKEAGVKIVAGDGALYGDTLGPPGSDGDTYLKMERHNTTVIVENLR
jgi:zinc/manganese transport system substrate-binding protein/manganese/iron transport system substrate-binding protein